MKKIGIIFVASVIAVGAQAEDARKIVLNEVILDQNNSVIQDEFTRLDKTKPCVAENPCEALTLGAAIAHALAIETKEDQNAAPEAKLKRGALAIRVAGAKELAFAAEDVATIKSAVLRIYNPIVAYRVVCAADPGDRACGRGER